MDKFVNGAIHVFDPSEDFKLFLNLVGVHRALRFLVATSSEHDAYMHANDFSGKICMSTMKKILQRHKICQQYVISKFYFKHDTLLLENISTHILLLFLVGRYVNGQ